MKTKENNKVADTSDRGFSLTGEGSNAASVDTNGTSGFAFASDGEMQAAIQINKIVDAIHGIGSGVRDSIGHISESLTKERGAQLPKRAMDGYADLVGAMGRIHSGSKAATLAASAIADALLEKAAEAVSEPPCSDDSKVSEETWDTVYDTPQDGPVSALLSEPQAETSEDQGESETPHRVVDLDRDTEIDALGTLELVSTSVMTDRTSYRPDQTVTMVFDGATAADEGDIAGILPYGEWPDKPLLRERPISSISGNKVHLSMCGKADHLKPGKYEAWVVKGDGTVSKTAIEPFFVDSCRTLKGMAAKTGYSTQVLYARMKDGTIKPENIIGRCITCNKTRLYESAIDDLIVAGVWPRKKRRARLEKFLAKRQPQE